MAEYPRANCSPCQVMPKAFKIVGKRSTCKIASLFFIKGFWLIIKLNTYRDALDVSLSNTGLLMAR